jgi:RND family efflux transporter MFP subunit
MKRVAKISIGVISLAAIIAAIAFTLSRNKNKAQEEIKKESIEVPFTVSATIVKEQTFNSNQAYRGTVEAKSIVTIFSEADGKLLSNNIVKGNYVTKGTVLAIVDKTIRQASNQLNVVSYDKAKIDYDNAKHNNERFQNLYKENNATAVEAENATLQLKAAQAQLHSIEQQIIISKKQIQQTTIVAHSSGFIIDKKSYSGDFVQPGTPLGTIADLNTVLIKVFVPESYVVKLSVGKKVNMNADVYPDETFIGVVKTILPIANEAKAFPVEIEVSNNRNRKLMAGMSMNVLFEPNIATSALVIPRTAIVANANGNYVYVIDANKKTSIKQVSIGRDFGNLVEIISGLTKEEIVITSGQSNIEQGKILKDYTITN